MRKGKGELNLDSWKKRAGHTAEVSGHVTLGGQRRFVTLVAVHAGGNNARRLWHVTAHHGPINTTVRAPDAIRWEAAELALLGLEIEIQKESENENAIV